MPPILVECPPSNGRALLLAGNVVVGSGGDDLSFWAGEDFYLLVWFIINTVNKLRVSVIYVSLSSVSYLLDSTVDYIIMNC